MLLVSAGITTVSRGCAEEKSCEKTKGKEGVECKECKDDGCNGDDKALENNAKGLKPATTLLIALVVFAVIRAIA